MNPSSTLPNKSIGPYALCTALMLVGIPLMGGTPARSYHDRMLMFDYMGGRQVREFYEKSSPRYVFSHAATEEMLVSFARERMAESALKIGADYLFRNLKEAVEKLPLSVKFESI